MTLVGKQSPQQPDDSSVFLTGGDQTRRDMTDSLFCTWDAAIDYSAVPQAGANLNDGKSSRLFEQTITLEPIIRDDQLQLNYSFSDQQPLYSSMASSTINHPGASINSLFCTWEVGIETNVLPHYTNTANQEEFSESSSLPPPSSEIATDCALLNYADFEARMLLDYSTTYAEPHMSTLQANCGLIASLFCTWNASADPNGLLQPANVDCEGLPPLHYSLTQETQPVSGSAPNAFPP